MMSEEKTQNIELREPVGEDGMSVNRLVSECPPLDGNSVYCNLLQASHFAGTSVAAEMQGDLVGFISGYIVPGRPDTLFVWQVAVHEKARGQGLAQRMIEAILARPQCRDVKFIETTITENNAASWGLFESIARRAGADLVRSPMFERMRHFNDQHDTEILARIGPIHQ